MQNFEFVESFESLDNLDDDLPNVLLLHELLVVLALADPLEHISIVCKLHNNT